MLRTLWGDEVSSFGGEFYTTELFYDLNWDPQVGSPSVVPQAAAERAGEILTELAQR